MCDLSMKLPTKKESSARAKEHPYLGNLRRATLGIPPWQKQQRTQSQQQILRHPRHYFRQLERYSKCKF